jgi:hypothetical protein
MSLWTLSIVLFFYFKHNVSETGFCLSLQVKHYSQLAQSIELVYISGPRDWLYRLGQLISVLPED